ncbi:MAG: DUF5108 domain-containing protein [Prevotella sp.]|nr:DUF5108 domain-containing protein [Prevotella sp.]
MKIYSIYQKVIVLAAAAMLLTACDKDVFDFGNDSNKGGVYKPATLMPISTILSEREEFSEYVKLLNYSGMFNALNQSSDGTTFTAFVPNNEAMAEFYQRRGISSVEQLTPAYARAFMLYHTVKGQIYPEDFIKKTTLQNLSNDNLSVEIDTENAGEATLNGEGKIIEMGDSAFNGAIYTLSRAMTPLVETVYDRIVEAGQSAILTQAFQQTGWDERLTMIVDTTYDENRNRIITHYYYTVLNVTDETFAASGINSVDGLKARLQADDDRGLTTDSLLREYVGYHILQNSYKTEDLGAMSGSETTRIWGTSADNQVFTVTYNEEAATEEDTYVLNASSLPVHFVTTSSNVLAKNGYVHELDNWMPVWEPEQATVVWDMGDYSEIKNMVDPEYYQPAEPVANDQKFSVFNAACFTYEVGESGTRNNSYGYISYVATQKTYTYREGTKEVVPKTYANNNDRVVFNLGYMGSVSMRTPVLVAGKYRVELNIVYTTNHNFMRTMSDGNGGMLRMTFDDNEDYTRFVSPYTKVPSALPGIYTSTIYDEIEFPETAAHTFSFVVLDPAASTNSNFSVQFDTIKFIPIQ